MSAYLLLAHLLLAYLLLAIDHHDATRLQSMFFQVQEVWIFPIVCITEKFSEEANEEGSV